MRKARYEALLAQYEELELEFRQSDVLPGSADYAWYVQQLRDLAEQVVDLEWEKDFWLEYAA